MTLWDLPSNKTATVTSVSSQLDTHVVDRLREMGIDCGQTLVCVRRGPIGGSLVLQLGGSIFAIDRELAGQISISVSA